MHMENIRILTVVIIIGLLFAAPTTIFAGQNNIEIVEGQCSDTSHTAEGPIGSNLTNRQSRFFCDTAVIIFLDKNKKHIQINFSQKESRHNQILGFAGRIDDEGIMLKLERVYLTPGIPTTVSDGWCKFFFKKPRLTSIFCGMKVDEVGRRTTAMVVFDTVEGQ